MQHAAGEIVDAVFSITCRNLPVDHAYALSRAVQAALPWFAQEPDAGLQPILGAESGSGWRRSENPTDLLPLSRRARLVLRIPRHRADDATLLLGHTLLVAEYPLRVDSLALRPLSRITTLFSRCVLFPGANDEEAFLAAAQAELAALGVHAASLLCGRVTPIATPQRSLETRSLLVADLSRERSLLLQQRGLGPERKLGCGLFVPHKAIGDLRARPD